MTYCTFFHRNSFAKFRIAGTIPCLAVYFPIRAFFLAETFKYVCASLLAALLPCHITTDTSLLASCIEEEGIRQVSAPFSFGRLIDLEESL